MLSGLPHPAHLGFDFAALFKKKSLADDFLTIY